MQASQLHDDKKQAQAFRQGGVQKVLPVVQQAHHAQRNKVVSAIRE
jgi:hypothetical protein